MLYLPVADHVCYVQLDHPNGDNSLLREAVVATTKYRYEHKYDDYDFDTYLRIMRQHGQRPSNSASVVMPQHS